MTPRSLVLLPIALVGCGIAVDWDGEVRGSGRIVHEARPVDGFDRVEIEDEFDVDIVVGPGFSVELTGDDDLLPLVRTEVHGNRLVVRTERDLRPRRSIKVAITLPRLIALSSSGSSDVRFRGVEASSFKVVVSGSSDLAGRGSYGDLEVTVSGSGDVALTGVARTVAVRVSGSSDVDLGGVAARRAAARVAGSGEVRLDVAERLDAEVSGSGQVRYTGNPAVEARVTGSGRVEPT